MVSGRQLAEKRLEGGRQESVSRSGGDVKSEKYSKNKREISKK